MGPALSLHSPCTFTEYPLDILDCRNSVRVSVEVWPMNIKDALQVSGLLFLFFVGLPSTLFAQSEVSREVMGGGGGVMKSETFRANGTMSQTAIGRARRPDSSRHLIGFWYWAKEGDPAALVVLPRVEGSSGDQVDIPLTLLESRGLQRLAHRRFTARIRFNGTLLEPVDGSVECDWEGDKCLLTVTGEGPEDSTGVLAMLSFRAKLGNAESTPLEIVDFRWDAAPSAPVMKRHGIFYLLDLCRAADSTRLFISGETSSIIAIRPNPVSTVAEIDFSLAEEGRAELYLVDILGNTVAYLLDAPLDPARYSVRADLSGLAVGRYFLTLRTPTEILTEAIEVSR